jgi:23S rRNA (uridine2552-2'-O)-methyltransferase
MSSASSKRWLQRQQNDHYVQRAKKEGYASRAAYKLLEINAKYKILTQGKWVVDLGAAPGGWTQVAQKIVAPAKVVAVDLLAMEVPSGAIYIQGDFTSEETLQALTNAIGDHRIDVILSDMAPNLSGHASIDQPRAMYLLEAALEFVNSVLAPGGVFLFKAFQGSGIDEYYKLLRQSFKQVRTIKPNASRAASREIYVLASDFIGYDS